MSFDTIDEAQKYYECYGRKKGFWIRTRTSFKGRNQSSAVSSMLFVCAREGKHATRTKNDVVVEGNDEREEEQRRNRHPQLEKLEQETTKWCREILRNSPTAIRVLKSALNAVDDGHAGLQELGGNATLLFYGTKEGNEGKTACMERRRPDFSKFPRQP
ncbi:hypothetical protein Vadar_008666 [Vaccinium darrowii]|uniref:Uncharacterized protein n=1 Tax=Vaccinium darrowii TaxID=229202 RepID=A0ACB7ZBC5_9ERIC|nr:hypothetical protein Vadar_008666 [Vaccinium darrowii]